MTLNEHHSGSTDGCGPQWRSANVGLGKWVRLLLAGNPFYIASAALLLFGINRLSIDPRFLSGEQANLLFNFSALQVYELILVGVVLFLAARRIFYDSTLLVILESMVLLVPFILVTQAALIDRRLALILCGFGAGLVVLRFSALKRWFSELNLPGRALVLLALLVALNGGIPQLFRYYVETGGSDAWERPYQLGWLLVLPLLQLLTLAFPRSIQQSDIGAQRAWLPILFSTLWLTGTAIHLWSMGYVAEREFNIYLLTPLLWSFCWTAYNRVKDFGSNHEARLKAIIAGTPVIILFAASTAPDSRLFFVLALANTIIFSILARHRCNVVPFQLLIVSCAMAVAGLPAGWATSSIPDFSRVKALQLGVGLFVLLHSLISRRPALAVCGAIIAAMAPGQFWSGISGNLQIEIGLIFLLLHSLCWKGDGEKFRIATAATWIVHAFGWTYVGGTISGWSVSSAAVVILITYAIVLYLNGQIRYRLIPAAALLVLCSWPITALIHFLETSPPGLLALISSFLLLAAGTWFAVCRKPLGENGGRSG